MVEEISIHSEQTASVSYIGQVQLPVGHVKGKIAAGLLFSAKRPLYTADFIGRIGTYPAGAG